MKLVTVATKSDRYFPYLVQSCERYGANLVVLGWGMPWQGFMMKFKLTIDYLKTLPEDEVVCVIDAYDVILLKPLEEIDEMFRGSGQRIIGALEGCNGGLYNIITSLYFGLCKGRPINAGTYIGYKEDLLAMMEGICNIFNCSDKTLDDQKILINYCKKENLFIDVERKYFMVICAFSKPPLLSDITKSCILHGPGNANMDSIITNLGYTITDELDHKKGEYFLSLMRHHLKTTIILLFVAITLLVLFVLTIRYCLKLVKRPINTHLH